MIRINLIERSRIRARRGPSLSTDWLETGGASPAMRIGLALIGLGILWLGGHYLYLQREATQLQQQLTQARVENQRLQGVQRAYNASLQKRREIQNRLQIIRSLHDSGNGPTTLMMAMGDAVNRTPGLWLTSINAENQDVQIKGQATSMNGVANLMTQLQHTGFFQLIELKDSNQTSTANGQQHPYQFELVAHRAGAHS